MSSQKKAVVDQVVAVLGSSFVPYTTNALDVLTDSQLEFIKQAIVCGLINGTIDYGKDRNDGKEVNKYGRSMVMNHLKKAKELNGNVVQSKAEGSAQRSISRSNNKHTGKTGSIDLASLPEALAGYVAQLQRQ